MNHIETAILNCYGIQEAEQNMVFAARLTQRGHTIRNMEDLMDLYHQTYSKETVEHIAGLPHPTVQKFMVITVAVVGASRRFLTQITRHQNEVKYMAGYLPVGKEHPLILKAQISFSSLLKISIFRLAVL